MQRDIIINIEDVHVSFWQNKVGVLSVKDLLTQFKNPFQDKHILHGISYAIERGESLGILGRNGCGKSTLLRTITGIIHPKKGRVTVNGTIAPILAIGAGLEQELTGFENIDLLLSLYGVPRKDGNALKNIMEFSELTHDALRMPVKQYSSGMIARLAFSISLANKADILIIDEVLAVGDQGFQQKCIDKIFELKAQGITILFVSHYPEDVKKVCDKAILLDGGLLINSGEAGLICDQYKQLFH
ncbi:MAG: ABC transporter ATP-binding protein [Chitinophagia bacterium]|nr:ABC transporter ATP-binding protein [Chitinophagia bacterium]